MNTHGRYYDALVSQSCSVRSGPISLTYAGADPISANSS